MYKTFLTDDEHQWNTKENLVYMIIYRSNSSEDNSGINYK